METQPLHSYLFLDITIFVIFVQSLHRKITEKVKNKKYLLLIDLIH
jgi:hypothetical protein